MARHLRRGRRAGLTTGAIPDGNRYFEMTFDFVDEVLRIEVQGGERREIPLAPVSVDSFQRGHHDGAELAR